MARPRKGRVTLRACPTCSDTPYPHYACDDATGPRPPGRLARLVAWLASFFPRRR